MPPHGSGKGWRQLRRPDRGHRVLLGGLALWLTFGGPVTVGMGDLIPFIIGAALYEPVLPFAALAWIEPDAPADDEA